MAPRRTLVEGAPDARAVQAAFLRLLDATPRSRAEALARLAASDPALHDAVGRLLRHEETGTEFLVPPPRVEWCTPERQLGRVLGGRWVLRGVLGAGGGGAVFRAVNRESGQRAALKLVRGLSEDSIRTIQREIALLRWLRLPGVARLLDDGVDGHDVFCVMELARGRRFPGAARIRRWSDVEGPALRLLETLSCIHAAGVVHRDLKPANVLVARDATVTVLDLGISAEVPRRYERAAVRASGGTPAYAAPEQLRGAAPDPRSDLYSFGVMVVEALSGRRVARGAQEVCRSLRAPPRVRRVLGELLEHEMRDRPPSAWEVLDALQRPLRSQVRRRLWTEEELRARFAGPDLLLHLREDAAAELWRRTRGRPREVEQEIRSWVRIGLARIERGLVVVDREGIERIGTLEFGRRASRELPRARGDRPLIRALQRGSPSAVVAAAQRFADRGLARGRPAAALAAAFEGAVAARTAGDARAESRILLTAATAAVRVGTATAFDRVLLLLQRAEATSQDLRHAETVVRAAMEYERGRVRPALVMVTEVCRGSRSHRVLRLAWSVRDAMSRLLGGRVQHSTVQGLRRWLPRGRPVGWRSVLESAEGWLRYGAAEFGSAVAHHRKAAALAADRDSRLRCMIDAAVAAVEGGSSDAERLVRRARSEAARLRSPTSEGRAVELLRTVGLQRGTAHRPDRLLVEVCRRLGSPGLTAGVALTEAAIAWRRGLRASAARLARITASIDGTSMRGVLALALGAASGDGGSSANRRRIEALVEGPLPPATALQSLALLALASPPRRRRLLARACRLRLPPTVLRSPAVREVLSVAEAWDILRGSSAGIPPAPGRRSRVSP